MSSSAGSIQLAPNETGPAPQDYLVPGSQTFDLLAVAATFDGAGAAGAFLPAVEIVSPGGVVMVRSVGSAIAQGAAEDVSFFPFSPAAAANAANPPLAGLYGGNNHVVAAGTTGFIPWNAFAGGDDVLDLTDPNHPTAKVAGLYVVGITVANIDGMPVGSVFDVQERLVNVTSWNMNARSAPSVATWVNAYVNMTHSRVLPIGGSLAVTVTNQDLGADHTYALNGATVAVVPNG